MATIGVGGGGGRRATNHDLPLVPFIDFLLCCVTFLLVTAAFSNVARLTSNAQVPGKTTEPADLRPKLLHLTLQEHSVRLTWKEGATVIASNDVPIRAIETERGLRYPELGEFVDRDWQANGAHRSPNDPSLDEAVLHVTNSTPYEDVIALVDALRSPVRVMPHGERASAYAVTFAAE